MSFKIPPPQNPSASVPEAEIAKTDDLGHWERKPEETDIFNWKKPFQSAAFYFVVISCVLLVSQVLEIELEEGRLSSQRYLLIIGITLISVSIIAYYLFRNIGVKALTPAETLICNRCHDLRNARPFHIHLNYGGGDSEVVPTHCKCGGEYEDLREWEWVWDEKPLTAEQLKKASEFEEMKKARKEAPPNP